MEKEVWLNRKDAEAYYGLSYSAFTRWAQQGKIVRREAPYGERMAYEYLQEEKLRDAIEVMKQVDNRWNQS